MVHFSYSFPVSDDRTGSQPHLEYIVSLAVYLERAKQIITKTFDRVLGHLIAVSFANL